MQERLVDAAEDSSGERNDFAHLLDRFTLNSLNREGRGRFRGEGEGEGSSSFSEGPPLRLPAASRNRSSNSARAADPLATWTSLKLDEWYLSKEYEAEELKRNPYRDEEPRDPDYCYLCDRLVEQAEDAKNEEVLKKSDRYKITHLLAPFLKTKDPKLVIQQILGVYNRKIRQKTGKRWDSRKIWEHFWIHDLDDDLIDVEVKRYTNAMSWQLRSQLRRDTDDVINTPNAVLLQRLLPTMLKKRPKQ